MPSTIPSQPGRAETAHLRTSTAGDDAIRVPSPRRSILATVVIVASTVGLRWQEPARAVVGAPGGGPLHDPTSGAGILSPT
jgi:hypothetical protein